MCRKRMYTQFGFSKPNPQKPIKEFLVVNTELMADICKVDNEMVDTLLDRVPLGYFEMFM